MDPLGKGSVNDQTLDLTYIFGQFCQNLCPKGPSMIFFKVFAFLLSKIHQKLKNRRMLEIFSNNKKRLFFIFVPNPFRIFISTYETFNFCIKITKVGFCLFPPAMLSRSTVRCVQRNLFYLDR